MALAADIEPRRVPNRQARGDGHPVPALLPGDLQVRQPGVDESFPRKLAFLALDLLHGQNVGAALGHKALHLFGAQPHGIDVPGRQSQAHASAPRKSGGRFCDNGALQFKMLAQKGRARRSGAAPGGFERGLSLFFSAAPGGG